MTGLLTAGTSVGDLSARYINSSTDQLELIFNDVESFDSNINTEDLSYTFERDANIAYTRTYHLKDANLSTSGRMTLESGDYGNVIFDNPSSSLSVITNSINADLVVDSFDNPYSGSLSLLGKSKFDDIEINSDIFLLGEDLAIQGWNVTVAANKILSTRMIDISGAPNYETAASIGPSGKHHY